MKNEIRGVSFRNVIFVSIVIGAIMFALLLNSIYLIANKYTDLKNSTNDFIKEESAIEDLQKASDYLTEQVRSFVVTEDDQHLNNYFIEAQVTKSREKAVEDLVKEIGSAEATENLEKALSESIVLMNAEYYAMRLVIDSCEDKNLEDYPKEIRDVVIKDDDNALSDEDKKKKALYILIDENYENSKAKIQSHTNTAIIQVKEVLESNVTDSYDGLLKIMIYQQTLITVLILFSVGFVIVIHYTLVKPINRSVREIRSGSFLTLKGSKEYKYLASTYNEIYKSNSEATESLNYEVVHDSLTSLYNRNGYDQIFKSLELDKTAFMLIDIDNFKKINDRYGHAVGDLVLKKVSEVLKKNFDPDDPICRIGGDEFVVFLIGYSEDCIESLKRKAQSINVDLKGAEKEIPTVTLSIGVAFGKNYDNTETLFRKADKALYQTKRQGRSGITFFNESMENSERVE